MEAKSHPKGVVIYEEKQWVLGLKEYEILNFLDIPHFGRIPQVNACVKKLLSYVHGGNL